MCTSVNGCEHVWGVGVGHPSPTSQDRLQEQGRGQTGTGIRTHGPTCRVDRLLVETCTHSPRSFQDSREWRWLLEVLQPWPGRVEEAGAMNTRKEKARGTDWRPQNGDICLALGR